MAYIFPADFKKQIQVDNLSQVTGGDTNLLGTAAVTAQEEAASYLLQKYDVSAEFTDTLQYDPTKEYLAGDRVYLDALPYSAAIPYPAFSLTLYNNNIYVNISSVGPEAFNPAHWVYLGAQYSIFYVGYPAPKFDYKAFYNIGDQVFYKNKVYTALKPTTGLSHVAILQYDYQTQDYPANPVNVWPDAPINGIATWGAGVNFSVPAGTLYSSPANNYAPSYGSVSQAQYTASAADVVTVTMPSLIGRSIIQIIKDIKPLLFAEYTFDTNTGIITLLGTSLQNHESLFILNSNTSPTPVQTKWVKGDNRSQQLLTYIIDIALYLLHSRIAPRNIPELRVKRYDEAIAWLKMAMKGSITPNLPVIQPAQGGRIRFGSSPKVKNIY